MTRRWVAGLTVGILAAGPLVGAAEHGVSSAPSESAPSASSEHGGASATEHGGQSVANTEPSPGRIRQAIRDHVTRVQKREGQFTIKDEVTGAVRTLTLIRVHERVGKTGELYYSCTDMRDSATRELLDLDFDVKNDKGKLTVIDQRIHKVDGRARYTYDDKDNRIPVIVQ